MVLDSLYTFTYAYDRYKCCACTFITIIHLPVHENALDILCEVDQGSTHTKTPSTSSSTKTYLTNWISMTIGANFAIKDIAKTCTT